MMYNLNGNEFLKGLNVTRDDNSLVYVAKKEMILPEKKIIIASDMNEVNTYLNEYRGGIVL